MLYSLEDSRVSSRLFYLPTGTGTVAGTRSLLLLLHLPPTEPSAPRALSSARPARKLAISEIARRADATNEAHKQQEAGFSHAPPTS